MTRVSWYPLPILTAMCLSTACGSVSVIPNYVAAGITRVSCCDTASGKNDSPQLSCRAVTYSQLAYRGVGDNGICRVLGMTCCGAALRPCCLTDSRRYGVASLRCCCSPVGMTAGDPE